MRTRNLLESKEKMKEGKEGRKKARKEGRKQGRKQGGRGITCVFTIKKGGMSGCNVSISVHSG
jgi:hypothetical protein